MSYSILHVHNAPLHMHGMTKFTVFPAFIEIKLRKLFCVLMFVVYSLGKLIAFWVFACRLIFVSAERDFKLLRRKL